MKRVKTYACKLMGQWEKDVKAEIEYTGDWSDFSVYTGKAGYALLYLEAGKVLNSDDYIEQAFFMAEKCTMHLHVHSHGRELTFLTGAGGPLAISAACAQAMNQPEKEHHFVHRFGLIPLDFVYCINIHFILSFIHTVKLQTRLQHLYHSTEAVTNYNSKLPDELLYGRAGCLYSLLFVKQYCKEKVDDGLITAIAKTIIDSGKHLAKTMQQKGHFTPPIMFEWHESKYLGPAHGMAGIIYLLLQVYSLFPFKNFTFFESPPK